MPNPRQTARKPQKHPRLPSHAKVTKRPLLRPAIPSAYASSDHPKVLYLSTHSPFIPTVKRIQSLLKKVEERSMQSLLATADKDNQIITASKLERIVGMNILESDKQNKSKAKQLPRGEEVFVKATGRAIERALNIALFFQEKAEMRVRVSTGTVDAIDDIDIVPNKGSKPNEKPKASEGEDDQDDDELPETRIRQLSTIEVAISMR